MQRISGMHIAHNERGTTLVEALVAAGLLITIVSGIAYLIVQAHRFAVRAEQMTVAVVAASARLERLRAIPWEYQPRRGWNARRRRWRCRRRMRSIATWRLSRDARRER